MIFHKIQQSKIFIMTVNGYFINLENIENGKP